MFLRSFMNTFTSKDSFFNKFLFDSVWVRSYGIGLVNERPRVRVRPELFQNFVLFFQDF